MPAGLTDAQRAKVAEVVRKYNSAVLPALVVDTACPRAMTVSTLSLVRDRVWCKRF